MFAKLAIFIASVTVFAVASPLPADASSLSNSCNSGPVQCCNSVQSADSEGISKVLDLLGIVAAATTQVGSSCSPLSALAITGNSCSSQPVCCSNNSFGGIVALGCSPLNANL